MSTKISKTSEFDPSHPPFESGAAGHVAHVAIDMFGWRGALAQGIEYEVDVRFDPQFFRSEPSQAWCPKLVHVEAVGFGEQALARLRASGVNESDLEREVLACLQNEPWIALEAAMEEAMTPSQRSWLEEMGLDMQLCAQGVLARFAAAFKSCPLQGRLSQASLA
jgi:hypothetical protein